MKILIGYVIPATVVLAMLFNMYMFYGIGVVERSLVLAITVGLFIFVIARRQA